MPQCSNFFKGWWNRQELVSQPMLSTLSPEMLCRGLPCNFFCFWREKAESKSEDEETGPVYGAIAVDVFTAIQPLDIFQQHGMVLSWMTELWRCGRSPKRCRCVFDNCVVLLWVNYSSYWYHIGIILVLLIVLITSNNQCSFVHIFR